MAKMGRPRIPREIRTCACGECDETFECKVNSKQRYILGHHCRVRKGKPLNHKPDCGCGRCKARRGETEDTLIC